MDQAQENSDVSSNLEFNTDNSEEQDKKKYKCTYPDCHAAYLRPSRLERHVRLHTGERPYKCQHEGCTKSYTNSSHLKRHIETHDIIKKRYKCTVCSLTISNLHNLKRHYKRVHVNTKICTECDKTFNKQYQLVEHQDTCHAATIYKCDKCKKSFLNNRKFKRHQKTHEEGKNYACPECLEVFNKWSLLCEHKKAKHVTEYVCNKCDKIFASRSNLTNHSKLHSENRAVISCTYDNCNKTYSFKSNLKNHIKINHLGEKFFCDICSIGFSSKRRLILHIPQHDQNKKKEDKTKKLNIQRKKRKDAGIPKKSALSKLIGLNLPSNLEKLIKEREDNKDNQEEYNKNSSEIKINT